MAEIAERAIQAGEYSTRCGSSEWSHYLLGKLIARLGQYKTLDLEKGWSELDKLNLFDKRDFCADFETKAKNIEKKVVREQILEALSKARGESESAEGSGGLAVGWDNFSIGATGRGATADATSTSEARKEVKDILEKEGIYGYWEGGKFTPKTLDVHTDDTLSQEWGRDISITYLFPSAAEAMNGMDLHLPAAQYSRYGPRVIDELRDEVAALEGEIDILRSQASMIGHDHDHDHDYAGQNHGHGGLASASHGHRAIWSRRYKLEYDTGDAISTYLTSVSVDDYPLAAISVWELVGEECGGDESVLPPEIVVHKEKWMIRVYSDSLDCPEMQLWVIYYGKEIVIPDYGADVVGPINRFRGAALN